MYRKVIPVAALAFAGFGFSGPTQETEIADSADVVVVKMVDKSATEFVFEPADITVSPGQTVRFVQTGAMPHNVEFRDLPAGTNLGAAAMGPFLLAAGETYEVTIDDRFAPGTHKYVCTPHEIMGMVGTITVEAAQ
jgi:plastocyanin